MRFPLTVISILVRCVHCLLWVVPSALYVCLGLDSLIFGSRCFLMKSGWINVPFAPESRSAFSLTFLVIWSTSGTSRSLFDLRRSMRFNRSSDVIKNFHQNQILLQILLLKNLPCCTPW